MTDGAPASDGRDLVVRYGDVVAVDGLSFAAHRGEVLALVGPNGAGKTSTVEAIEGYRVIAGGSARVLGLDPTRDRAELSRRIGVMLQKGGIYPMLGPARILHLFADYYPDPEDPEELLDRVGLHRCRRTPWRRLSGGEQQRLSLALALIGRPEVLFLDEPTAGVDPEGRIVVRDVIGAQRDQGRCVLLTTHELGEAERLADRVAIVGAGVLLAEGTPADLTSGTGDGAIRFSTVTGIDVDTLGDGLAAALARGPGSRVTVTEEHPGSYRVDPPVGSSVPRVVAALTNWLAERDLSVTDLRTGRSLEEAYLAITGSHGDEPEIEEHVQSGGRTRRRGRGRSGTP